MLNGLAGADLAPGARGGQQVAKEAKIGVGKMTIEHKKSAVPTTPEPEAIQKALEMKKVTEELTRQKIEEVKKRAEDAGKLLKEYHIEPRVVLRLLTDGEAVVGALEGQVQAEMEILRARGDLGAEQKQKLSIAIQEKYKKLIQYSENREESTRGLIKKLETSTKPEDKALLLDIKSARAQIEQSVHQEKVNQIKQLLKTPSLTPDIKTKYEKYQEVLETKITEIKNSNNELKDKRDEIKDVDGKAIPNIVQEMAVAVSGGEVDAVKDAEAEPVRYIQEAIINALTTDGGTAKLADNLVKATLLNEADKEGFIKDMELGLKTEDIVKMTQNIAGKTALGFLGLISMLGYAALQRRLQENHAS